MPPLCPCLLCGLDRILLSLLYQINFTSFASALTPFDFSTSGLDSPARVLLFSILNTFSHRYSNNQFSEQGNYSDYFTKSVKVYEKRL